MARYSGIVGFRLPSNVVDGVASDNIVERPYSGEVLNQVATQIKSDKVNDDVSLSDRVRIMADGYALEKWPLIKFVERAGVLWSVTSVQVEHPRLVLSLGGVYDGKRAPSNGGGTP